MYKETDFLYLKLNGLQISHFKTENYSTDKMVQSKIHVHFIVVSSLQKEESKHRSPHLGRSKRTIDVRLKASIVI